MATTSEIILSNTSGDEFRFKSDLSSNYIGNYHYDPLMKKYYTGHEVSDATKEELSLISNVKRTDDGFLFSPLGQDITSTKQVMLNDYIANIEEAIDTGISELVSPELVGAEEEQVLTKFFNDYRNLRDILPVEGATDSVEYLVQDTINLTSNAVEPIDSGDNFYYPAYNLIPNADSWDNILERENFSGQWEPNSPANWLFRWSARHDGDYELNTIEEDDGTKHLELNMFNKSKPGEGNYDMRLMTPIITINPEEQYVFSYEFKIPTTNNNAHINLWLHGDAVNKTMENYGRWPGGEKVGPAWDGSRENIERNLHKRNSSQTVGGADYAPHDHNQPPGYPGYGADGRSTTSAFPILDEDGNETGWFRRYIMLQLQWDYGQGTEVLTPWKGTGNRMRIAIYGPWKGSVESGESHIVFKIRNMNLSVYNPEVPTQLTTEFTEDDYRIAKIRDTKVKIETLEALKDELNTQIGNIRAHYEGVISDKNGRIGELEGYLAVTQQQYDNAVDGNDDTQGISSKLNQVNNLWDYGSVYDRGFQDGGEAAAANASGIFDNNGDGWDDASFNAGYDSGWSAAFSQAGDNNQDTIIDWKDGTTGPDFDGDGYITTQWGSPVGQEEGPDYLGESWIWWYTTFPHNSYGGIPGIPEYEVTSPWRSWWKRSELIPIVEDYIAGGGSEGIPDDMMTELEGGG